MPPKCPHLPCSPSCTQSHSVFQWSFEQCTPDWLSLEKVRCPNYQCSSHPLPTQEPYKKARTNFVNIFTQIRTYVCTYVHKYVHSCKHARKHARIHLYMRIIQAPTPPPTHTQTCWVAAAMAVLISSIFLLSSSLLLKFLSSSSSIPATVCRQLMMSRTLCGEHVEVVSM